MISSCWGVRLRPAALFAYPLPTACQRVRCVPPPVATRLPFPGLIDHVQLDAAVLGSAALGLIAGHRPRFAVADDVHPLRRDAVIDEVAEHRLGAAHRQRLVVLVAADRVGVTLDGDAHVRVLLAARRRPHPTPGANRDGCRSCRSRSSPHAGRSSGWLAAAAPASVAAAAVVAVGVPDPRSNDRARPHRMAPAPAPMAIDAG